MKHYIEMAPGVTAGWFVPDDGWNPSHPAIDDTPLLLPQQTHTVNIGEVFSTAESFSDTDALITRKRRMAVGVRTADCVPILLYAPDIQAVAAIHAGWKGTLGGIVTATTQRLMELGAQPSEIQAVIGACICGDCYEVSPELASMFIDAGYAEGVTAPPSQDPLTGKETNPRRPHLDLPAINKLQLESAGVLSPNIRLLNLCTRHSPLLLPSWRRTPGEPRRLITFIGLQ